jgi:hypothetical protein
MQIGLLHPHYSEDHLVEVAEKMKKLGAPKIRAIWSECYGMWMAVEGCHRIRAAKSLGLIPVIVDVSSQKYVRIQLEENNVRVAVATLEEELTNDLPRTEIISFDEE